MREAVVSALSDAVEWKLNYIRELIPVIRRSALTDREKTDLIKILEQEKKDLEGSDRGKAWDVAKANLERLVKSAKSVLADHPSTTDGDEIVAWNDILRAREKLLDALVRAGRP
jgi:hypothetical protein